MADNSYQPNVGRRAGGDIFYMQARGDGTVGSFNQGVDTYFYFDAAVAHTTKLSVLQYGVWNTVSNASTGCPLLLPTAYPGAEVWFASADATTGAFPICTSTAGISILIGTSTEAGIFADSNTAIQTSGNVLGFKALATSQWIVISNVGASAASTYTTALASTA